MKILCYGASVTAQKFESGYFQQLSDLLASDSQYTLERVTFGASQFEYAGYAFMSDVIDKQPDICIIDWLTPGMTSFNQYKIDLLNYSLIKSGCVPIWVFFPRVDNFSNVPDSYRQVTESANNFNIPFIDARTSLPNFIGNEIKYLRDKVHTTFEGARIYANAIFDTLSTVTTELENALENAKHSSGYSCFNDSAYSVPLVKPLEAVVDDSHQLIIEFEFNGGFLEIFLETVVGPHLCYLSFTVFKDNEVVDVITFNPADPWCHYERNMVVETLRKRYPSGNYKIVVSKQSGNPFEDIKTKKVIEQQCPDSDRYMSVSRISINCNSFATKVK